MRPLLAPALRHWPQQNQQHQNQPHHQNQIHQLQFQSQQQQPQQAQTQPHQTQQQQAQTQSQRCDNPQSQPQAPCQVMPSRLYNQGSLQHHQLQQQQQVRQMQHMQQLQQLEQRQLQIHNIQLQQEQHQLPEMQQLQQLLLDHSRSPHLYDHHEQREQHEHQLQPWRQQPQQYVRVHPPVQHSQMDTSKMSPVASHVDSEMQQQPYQYQHQQHQASLVQSPLPPLQVQVVENTLPGSGDAESNENKFYPQSEEIHQIQAQLGHQPQVKQQSQSLYPQHPQHQLQEQPPAAVAFDWPTLPTFEPLSAHASLLGDRVLPFAGQQPRASSPRRIAESVPRRYSVSPASRMVRHTIASTTPTASTPRPPTPPRPHHGPLAEVASASAAVNMLGSALRPAAGFPMTGPPGKHPVVVMDGNAESDRDIDEAVLADMESLPFSSAERRVMWQDLHDRFQQSAEWQGSVLVNLPSKLPLPDIPEGSLDLLFRSYDANNSGELSSEELSAMLRDMQCIACLTLGRRRRAAKKQAHVQLARFVGADASSMMTAAVADMLDFEIETAKAFVAERASEEAVCRIHQALDANSDGKVTREDFLHRARQVLFDPNPPEELDEVQEAIQAMSEMIMDAKVFDSAGGAFHFGTPSLQRHPPQHLAPAVICASSVHSPLSRQRENWDRTVPLGGGVMDARVLNDERK